MSQAKFQRALYSLALALALTTPSDAQGDWICLDEKGLPVVAVDHLFPVITNDEMWDSILAHEDSTALAVTVRRWGICGERQVQLLRHPTVMEVKTWSTFEKESLTNQFGAWPEGTDPPCDQLAVQTSKRMVDPGSGAPARFLEGLLSLRLPVLQDIDAALNNPLTLYLDGETVEIWTRSVTSQSYFEIFIYGRYSPLIPLVDELFEAYDLACPVGEWTREFRERQLREYREEEELDGQEASDGTG